MFNWKEIWFFLLIFISNALRILPFKARFFQVDAVEMALSSQDSAWLKKSSLIAALAFNVTKVKDAKMQTNLP